MTQSPSYRLKAAVLVTTVGLVGTVVLGSTVLNPSPTQVSAPHSLTEIPDYAGTAQINTPFYDAVKPPAGVAPGTLLKSEPILGGPPGITAKRFSYVSQTAAGKPLVVTALYAVRDAPSPGPNGRPLVAFAHGTTGMAPGCGISQAPFTPNSTGIGTWDQVLSALVGAGFAVVATDYANLGVPGTPNYLVMKGEAHDVLNSARAAFALDPTSIDRSEVAIMGHSQGGHSALSAAYEAPTYAPDIAIKGTIAIAPAIFPPAPLLIKFIQASPDKPADYFLSFIADAVNSWSANYPGRIKSSDVFTPAGVKAANVALTKCLRATAAAFSGPKGDYVQKTIPTSLLSVAQENFPVYRKYAQPMLIQQGLEDTTVVPGVNLAAARTFCLQGSQVNLQTFPDDVHSSVLYTGQPDAITWLNDRFEGKPFKSDCGGL